MAREAERLLAEEASRIPIGRHHVHNLLVSEVNTKSALTEPSDVPK